MPSPEDENSGCNDPTHANAAVEKLAEKVDGLLTGGLHGEFYEESRSSAKNRHQQLSEMFELRQLFQEVKAGQEKILRTAAIREEQATAAAAATTKGGGLSANNVAAIEAVVNRLTADKFRDMSLLSQRLRDSEKEVATLRDQVEDLKFQLKMKNKSTLKSQFPSLKQHQKLANEVATFESAMQRYDMEIYGRKALQSSIEKLQKEVKGQDNLEARVKSLEMKVGMDEIHTDPELEAVDSGKLGTMGDYDEVCPYDEYDSW
ncbi:hypothetical protein AC578_868 [Pseudocercospora eumusae]|uniref:Uncharacterized protein n=1 Tax=Pseudocercospora eumusae TaxID=321146 RepID=A0A139H3Z8_9PEZI|nr:hypothetical protein AC578_868 [Pseudocercospora eumusae]